MTAPLTFGQLSVWRDIDRLPRARWHEANALFTVGVAPGRVGVVRSALDALASRHAALRTVYDLMEPARPAQRVEPTLSLPLEHATVDCRSDADRVLSSFVERPFDLRSEAPARALLLDRPDSPDENLLAISKHHIAADAWAVGVLEAELVELLAGRRTQLPPPSEDLGLLALEQRAPGWRARRDASDRHHAAVLASPAATFVGAEPGAGVVQGSVESGALFEGACERADRAGVSLSTVLMAAYTSAVARHCDHTGIRLGLMSSNRFGTRWRQLVTSMNQWVPLAVTATGADLDPATLTALQAAALRAYRVALCDVDATRLVGPLVPTCTYNLVSPWPATPGYDRAAEAEHPEIVWENVFSAIGPRCYLRIFQTPSTLILTLRTTGLGRRITGDILRGIPDLIMPSQLRPS